MCLLARDRIFLSIATVLFAAPRVLAFDITQVTDNSTEDWNPAVSGSNVVWQRCDGGTGSDCSGGDWEIYLWDGSSITQITNNTLDDAKPDVSGSNVVWQRCDGGTGSDCSGGDWEIYLWDGSSITPITDDTTSNQYPAISGSNVVWQECDGDTDSACTGGDWEIYLWDGSLPIVPTQITDDTTDDERPDVSGANVVWGGSDGSDSEIYLWDGSLPIVSTQITDDTDEDLNPAISDSDVVWQGCDGGADSACTGGDWEIYLWDGSLPIVPTQITDDTTDDERPDISGSNVVWEGSDGSDSEIYLWDGSLPIVSTQITDNTGDDWNPAISDSNVVWEGSDGSDHEIFMTSILETEARLSKEQQCVQQMNKRGEQVNKVQLKENEKCLRDFQKEKLTTSFDACTIADRKGKVQKAKDMTVKKEIKKCDSLAVPPLFGYTDATTVNTAAVNGALALVDDIFGEPVLDAALVTKTADKDTAKCQLEMLKRGDKVESTAVKEVVKAKKKALKEGLDSSAALRALVEGAFPANKKIQKTETQLRKKVEKKCAGIPSSPDVLFPGACADPDLPNVEDCVIAAALCQACSKIKAFDNLSLDCDLADDQLDNGTCP